MYPKFSLFMRVTLLAGLAVFALLPAGAAAKAKAPQATDYPVLQKLMGADKNLSYDYLGRIGGLEAWLVSGADLMQVVYVTPQDKMALVGATLVGADGKEAGSLLLQDFLKNQPERAARILENVRSEIVAGQKQQERAAAQENNTSASERFWKRLSQVGIVTFGDKAGTEDTSASKTPEIYAIMDPAMPETLAIWHILSPLAEKNHLVLHIVPLAVSTAETIMDVAMILGSDSPQQSWRDLMDGEKAPDGTTPAGHGVLQMKATVDLAQELNLRQLPLLVYRSDNGGVVRMIRGMPRDWAGFLSDAGVGQDTE